MSDLGLEETKPSRMLGNYHDGRNQSSGVGYRPFFSLKAPFIGW